MWYKNFFTSLLILALLASCALRSASTGLPKYQQAMLCYAAQKYHEASQLFEEVLPSLQGKTEEASAYFYEAYCSFYKKQYVKSAERFQYFYETFLRDARIEEAVYMRGHALYLGSPDVKRDQTLTQEAISALRDYLHGYPEGAYRKEAFVQLEGLCDKLAFKAFNDAKLYHQLKHYRAAVISLENLQKDFPTSLYSEGAAYLKADAQYQYFKATEGAEQDEQLALATKYCKEFLDSYPDSAYVSAVETIYENLFSVNKTKKP